MRRLLSALLLVICLTDLGPAQSPAINRLVDVLNDGKTAFGSMVQDRTAEGGVALGRDNRLDFIFYDMERNYDLPAFKTFLGGLRSTGRQALPAALVRIAPVSASREAAAQRVAELLGAGADGIVFPQTRTASDAEFGVNLLKSHPRGLWPLNPKGTLVGYFMIESVEGIANVQSIISTPGVSFAAPGQGSLRSAYNGDQQAAENAIQTVIRTCRLLNAVCAKLVTTGDVEKRIQEGYRVIMGPPAALDLGRKLTGQL